MNIRNYFIILLHLVMAMRTVQGKRIDIRKEVSNIITRHNNERSDRQLRASDMMEMTWDDNLAEQASDYAERCVYRRPSRRVFNLGSNLYYEVDYVHGPKSIHRLVNTAFRAWTLYKSLFTFSSKCGGACSYVQMITSQANRVGCALSTCAMLETGNLQESYSSLFVCFYSPRTSLMNSFPYRNGDACSRCPSNTLCRNSLCVPSDLESMPFHIQYPNQPRNTWNSEDALTDTEIHYLTSVHNSVRRANNKDAVKWDPYLEEWANWIVSCSADYPGPHHTYTNFDRLDQGESVYDKIYDWSAEGELVYIQLIHGCRTPFDNSRCNHFTNIRQPMVTSIGCAAKDCKDGTRQLVCLYDNKVDRVYRRSDNNDNARADRRSSIQRSLTG